jgi:hypothetical protein
MILAKFTTEIASRCGDGIGFGRGENMKEWFFFDRINVFGNQCSVNQ